MQNFEMKSSKLSKNPLLTKVFTLFIMILLLQIPLYMVGDLIRERGNLYEETSMNIGNEWGREQKIAAPFLTIVYPKSEKKEEEQRKMIILPDTLDAKITLNQEERKRGIYRSLVYNANAKIQGYFDKIEIPNDPNVKIYLSFGLSDTKAILKVNQYQFGTKNYEDLESGTRAEPVLSRGISILLSREELQGKERIPFSMDIDFRGSKKISMLPLGEKNTVEISSPWTSPSFTGILPTSKEISREGFQGKWEVTHLVRNYPQRISVSDATNYFDFVWEEEEKDFERYDVYEEEDTNVIQVELFNPVTNYTQVARACKYGILFIMLSIIVVYIFEVASRQFTHYIQYGVVGISLVLFYLLLLSLSEHFSFGISYLISSLAIIIPNSLYMMSLTQNKKFAFGMLVFLTGIYAVLFSILRMEQYALLTGTILILVVLYVIMYLTRRLDIYFQERE